MKCIDNILDKSSNSIKINYNVITCLYYIVLSSISFIYIKMLPRAEYHSNLDEIYVSHLL